LHEFVIICDLPGVAIDIGGGNGHGPFCKFRAFGGGGGPKNIQKILIEDFQGQNSLFLFKIKVKVIKINCP
jgi:hypothetical protein